LEFFSASVEWFIQRLSAETEMNACAIKTAFVSMCVAAVCACLVQNANAGGILPETDNRIIIGGQFTHRAPTFVLIFSAKPLRAENGQLLTAFSEEQLARLKSQPEMLVLRVHGIHAAGGQFEYSFGTGADANMPWNDGREFHWKDWEKYSPDIWDNLCIAAGVGAGERSASGVITDVTVHKGGKVLYSSRLKQSYPNKHRIDVSLTPVDVTPRAGRHPALNLALRMEQFRRDYYELGNSRILALAYSDLAQTEKRKYAQRGNNWCSEFSSYIYRKNSVMTPDPDRSDVHWKSMRTFFQQSGKVFSAREVAAWSNEKKLATIKPGTFVSILIGDSTHSIIFTTWVIERGKPITKYVGVSGNNKGMVWPHAPMKLPDANQFTKMTAERLRDFDQKVYFAVPSSTP
jgi:hypothetical protein